MSLRSRSARHRASNSSADMMLPRKLMGLAPAVTLLLLAGTHVACHAASFDCNRANLAVERAICADSGVSKLDEELSAAYGIAARGPDRQRVVAEQRFWISTVRNRCGDAACLASAYRARLGMLQPARAAGTSSCSVTEEALTGHWREDAGSEGDFEEFRLAVDGASRVFSSWRHHRPEVMGMWTYHDCQLHIMQDGGAHIAFNYRVVGLERKVLRLDGGDGSSNHRYRAVTK